MKRFFAFSPRKIEFQTTPQIFALVKLQINNFLLFQHPIHQKKERASNLMYAKIIPSSNCFSLFFFSLFFQPFSNERRKKERSESRKMFFYRAYFAIYP